MGDLKHFNLNEPLLFFMLIRRDALSICYRAYEDAGVDPAPACLHQVHASMRKELNLSNNARTSSDPHV